MIFFNEFKLTLKSNHFIGCYFLNNANLMLKELIKIMPEIYYYKTKGFLEQINFKKLKEHMKKDKEIIYNNIRNIIQSFIYEAELNNKIINQLFYPLFYLNGFYDLANLFNNKLSTSDEMKINLSLNTINTNFENLYINELMRDDNNILFYYLNHKLKQCLNIFLQKEEIIMKEEYIFIKYESQFQKLFNLMENIKNKQYQNYDKIENEDIDKLIAYINNRSNDKIINEDIDELVKLYGITSYISLLFFKLYIDQISVNDKLEHFIEEDPKKYYDIIFSLYKLSLMFSSIEQNYPEHKKLLIFSLFNIFNINLLPEVYIYKHLQSLNVCLLNHKSILLSKSLEGTNLDIFDENKGFIYSQNKRIIPIFDTNGNNLLINNEILYKLFTLLLSKYINIIYEKNVPNLKK